MPKTFTINTNIEYYTPERFPDMSPRVLEMYQEKHEYENFSDATLVKYYEEKRMFQHQQKVEAWEKKIVLVNKA